jgi:inhibitor of KinA
LFDPITYKAFGERAILIEWEAKVSAEILQDIVRYKQLIATEKIEEITDAIIGYNSLTIIFKEKVKIVEAEIEKLKKLYHLPFINTYKKPKLWKIPVCYDTCFGIDLKEMAELHHSTIENIIDLHTSAQYTVFFIGFLPGFLYLGGLNTLLQTPRKAIPRLKVEKGAVAIGGSQTGIYPQQSAGGWNIIGNTPVPFFDVEKSPPCFAESGDKIQFVSINLDTYQSLEKEVSLGEFDLKKWQKNA